MKKCKSLILVLFLFLTTQQIFASHIVGLRITYEYVNAGNYKFKLKLYRDCSGIPAPTAPVVCFRSISNCATAFTSILAMDSANSGFPVPFNSCSVVGPTFCTGGNIFAFEEYNYYGSVTVPLCNDWIVSYSECCRNPAITNIAGAGGYGAYVETRFNNLDYPGNSSPEFNAVPVNYYCAGIPSLVDYSAYDPDGDSLSYEFSPIQDGQCMTGATGAIPYINPLTYMQPLATLVPTTFDPFTGQINFTPSAIQISVIGFKVNEYRNGVLIGSVRRDDEVVVVGAFANPDTIAGTVYYDLNSNNVFDGSDFYSSGTLVHMGTGNTYASTFINGKYLFQTVAGSFDVDIPNPPLYTIPNPALYTVNTSGGGTFYGGNDFALQPVPNMNDLKVSLNHSSAPVPGQLYPIIITYDNVGSTNQTNVDVQLTLDPELAFVSSTPVPTNVNGNMITWNFPSLNMFSGGIIYVDALTDTLALLGDSVYCTATITPVAGDITPTDNSDSFWDIIQSSFDPNYKAVSPEGDLNLSFVTNQDWLTYTIYFQNLGTAAANFVKVSDLIDYDLNLGSFELVAASKACVVGLVSPNRLEFSFYNMNLPPAIIDEPHSHGFVEFRIKCQPGLNIGKYISNNAQIVFDFNPPVYTNTVVNLIVGPTSVNENPESIFHLNVFPNPATNYFEVELTNDRIETTTLQVHNILGGIVYENKYLLKNGFNVLRVPVSEMRSGIYFLELSKHDGRSVVKVIAH
ncbi:MAG: T9SS type A sorting domain-containing protein [Bacteroidia bacterium]